MSSLRRIRKYLLRYLISVPINFSIVSMLTAWDC